MFWKFFIIWMDLIRPVCVRACVFKTKAQTLWVNLWSLLFCLSAVTQSASLSFTHFYECVWVGAGEPVLPPACVCVHQIPRTVCKLII